MLIKIIGDGAIALSGMRGAIFGLECECDRLFGLERSSALYVFFSTRRRAPFWYGKVDRRDQQIAS
ncbi:hypothetical protein QUA30_11300 [Microcoleus sp. Pol14C2]|uniref:hypothetical protein n=1 Tax=unclassified Microcoleus TaxID=2642155 RepID=UPI002FD06033